MAATAEQKLEVIKCGNSNTDAIGEIIRSLRWYSIDNQCVPDDIEFSDGKWDGQYRMLINVYYEVTVPFTSIEDVQFSAVKYSEFVALILRGAERFALTTSKEVSDVKIAKWHWWAWNVLSIEYR